MHTRVSESVPSSCSSELFEALPVAAALFSSDGRLLCASAWFRTAMRCADPTGQGTQEVRARFSEGIDRATLLRSSFAPQEASARRLSNGEVLVWLSELGDDAQRRKAAFLSIASHDLRGAIANARSYASLLLSPRMELGDRARHCAEVIQRNADRALRQLSDCFDLFLSQVGALDLDCAPEELSPLFDEVAAQARTLASSRGVRLEVEMPSQLPAASVDRVRLIEAALAFVAHSVSRVRKGDPVHLLVKEQRKGIFLQVSDNEELASAGGASGLYDEQARAIAEGKLGAGFRLGLARTIIEAHGGEVGVRTGEGSGSAFFFTLPIERGGAASTLPPAAGQRL